MKNNNNIKISFIIWAKKILAIGDIKSSAGRVKLPVPFSKTKDALVESSLPRPTATDLATSLPEAATTELPPPIASPISISLTLAPSIGINVNVSALKTEIATAKRFPLETGTPQQSILGRQGEYSEQIRDIAGISDKKARAVEILSGICQNIQAIASEKGSVKTTRLDHSLEKVVECTRASIIVEEACITADTFLDENNDLLNLNQSYKASNLKKDIRAIRQLSKDLELLLIMKATQRYTAEYDKSSKSEARKECFRVIDEAYTVLSEAQLALTQKIIALKAGIVRLKEEQASKIQKLKDEYLAIQTKASCLGLEAAPITFESLSENPLKTRSDIERFNEEKVACEKQLAAEKVKLDARIEVAQNSFENLQNRVRNAYNLSYGLYEKADSLVIVDDIIQVLHEIERAKVVKLGQIEFSLEDFYNHSTEGIYQFEQRVIKLEQDLYQQQTNAIQKINETIIKAKKTLLWAAHFNLDCADLQKETSQLLTLRGKVAEPSKHQDSFGLLVKIETAASELNEHIIDQEKDNTAEQIKLTKDIDYLSFISETLSDMDVRMNDTPTCHEVAALAQDLKTKNERELDLYSKYVERVVGASKSRNEVYLLAVQKRNLDSLYVATNKHLQSEESHLHKLTATNVDISQEQQQTHYKANRENVLKNGKEANAIGEKIDRTRVIKSPHKVTCMARSRREAFLSIREQYEAKFQGIAKIKEARKAQYAKAHMRASSLGLTSTERLIEIYEEWFKINNIISLVTLQTNIQTIDIETIKVELSKLDRRDSTIEKEIRDIDKTIETETSAALEKAQKVIAWTTQIITLAKTIGLNTDAIEGLNQTLKDGLLQLGRKDLSIGEVEEQCTEIVAASKILEKDISARFNKINQKAIQLLVAAEVVNIWYKKTGIACPASMGVQAIHIRKHIKTLGANPESYAIVTANLVKLEANIQLAKSTFDIESDRIYQETGQKTERVLSDKRSESLRMALPEPIALTTQVDILHRDTQLLYTETKKVVGSLESILDKEIWLMALIETGAQTGSHTFKTQPRRGSGSHVFKLDKGQTVATSVSEYQASVQARVQGSKFAEITPPVPEISVTLTKHEEHVEMAINDLQDKVLWVSAFDQSMNRAIELATAGDRAPNIKSALEQYRACLLKNGDTVLAAGHFDALRIPTRADYNPTRAQFQRIITDLCKTKAERMIDLALPRNAVARIQHLNALADLLSESSIAKELSAKILAKINIVLDSVIANPKDCRLDFPSLIQTLKTLSSFIEDADLVVPNKFYSFLERLANGLIRDKCYRTTTGCFASDSKTRTFSPSAGRLKVIAQLLNSIEEERRITAKLGLATIQIDKLKADILGVEPSSEETKLPGSLRLFVHQTRGVSDSNARCLFLAACEPFFLGMPVSLEESPVLKSKQDLIQEEIAFLKSTLALRDEDKPSDGFMYPISAAKERKLVTHLGAVTRLIESSRGVDRDIISLAHDLYQFVESIDPIKEGTGCPEYQSLPELQQAIASFCLTYHAIKQIDYEGSKNKSPGVNTDRKYDEKIYLERAAIIVSRKILAILVNYKTNKLTELKYLLKKLKEYLCSITALAEELQIQEDSFLIDTISELISGINGNKFGIGLTAQLGPALTQLGTAYDTCSGRGSVSSKSIELYTCHHENRTEKAKIKIEKATELANALVFMLRPGLDNKAIAVMQKAINKLNDAIVFITASSDIAPELIQPLTNALDIFLWKLIPNKAHTEPTIATQLIQLEENILKLKLYQKPVLARHIEEMDRSVQKEIVTKTGHLLSMFLTITLKVKNGEILEYISLLFREAPLKTTDFPRILELCMHDLEPTLDKCIDKYDQGLIRQLIADINSLIGSDPAKHKMCNDYMATFQGLPKPIQELTQLVSSEYETYSMWQEIIDIENIQQLTTALTPAQQEQFQYYLEVLNSIKKTIDDFKELQYVHMFLRNGLDTGDSLDMYRTFINTYFPIFARTIGFGRKQLSDMMTFMSSTILNFGTPKQDKSLVAHFQDCLATIEREKAEFSGVRQACNLTSNTPFFKSMQDVVKYELIMRDMFKLVKEPSNVTEVLIDQLTDETPDPLSESVSLEVREQTLNKLGIKIELTTEGRTVTANISKVSIKETEELPGGMVSPEAITIIEQRVKEKAINKALEKVPDLIAFKAFILGKIGMSIDINKAASPAVVTITGPGMETVRFTVDFESTEEGSAEKAVEKAHIQAINAVVQQEKSAMLKYVRDVYQPDLDKGIAAASGMFAEMGSYCASINLCS
jgi:hypothetical protein